jgi:hypothetical protein
MARILSSERQVVVRMAEMVGGLPDTSWFDDINGVLDSTADVTKSLISYLNSLADLEESMADSLANVLETLRESDEE